MALLTLDEVDGLARRGSFVFDIVPDSHQVDLATWMSSGDGVDDLDTVLATIDRLPRNHQLFVVTDSGTRRLADREDVVAIRTRFVAVYGTVPKINEYAPLDWST